MHKSRFCGFVIDCKVEDINAAATFWSRAFGRDLEPVDESSPTYRTLQSRPNEPVMLVQQVDHDSRAHLDIETTDVEAEVERLEKLGARRVTKVRTWWVMEAPSGQRFCVVRPQTKRLEAEGNEWP